MRRDTSVETLSFADGSGFVKVGDAEADPEDLRLVREAWEEAVRAMHSEEWYLLVLDEMHYAIG